MVHEEDDLARSENENPLVGNGMSLSEEKKIHGKKEKKNKKNCERLCPLILIIVVIQVIVTIVAIMRFNE